MYFFTISSREFWVTAFHLLNRERNLSELFSSLLLLLSPSPFFSQVTFGWLYVYGMRQCSSIWALKYISKRSTHFIMNCWQSSNRSSWHRKFVSWTMAWRWRQCFCECVSARKKCSVFRRQFEALWSAPIETFGSIYIMNLSVESPPPSEVASIHSKCNKRMRLRFSWAFQICSDCSHRNCPYFISDRVAEVDFV